MVCGAREDHERLGDTCIIFFSSRRRHTRSLRDWSSDVCSSDLELVHVRVHAELLQRLVLDLADALARDVEDAADLVERRRRVAVEAEAQLEHASLTLVQLPEHLLERLVAERQPGRL